MSTITTDAKFNTGKFNTQYFNGFADPGNPVKNASYFINKTYHFPFRKLEIKRRQSSDALYESSWQDISKYVTRWGQFKTAIDDQRVNQFVHSGYTFNVKNDFGEFNPEYDGASLFYGYFTRYRTLVRLTAGYTDTAGNQYPTDATQGIFIMDSEIDIAPKNKEVQMNCKSIISPFQETRADEIMGITTSITSSEIVTKIRDATDGSGNFLFRNFITSTAWSIQSTTTILTGLGTITALSDFTVWELMNKLAELEGYVLYATKTGGIVFSDRLPNQDSPEMVLYGAGFRDPNVIRINNYKEATSKLFTHYRFKYLEEDTETSFVTAGTATAVDTRSNEWKYGRRTYEMENTFFSDSSAAKAVVSKLIGEFSNLRNELNIDCPFMPQLEVLDRVSIFHSESSEGSVYLWDTKDWAADTTTSDGSNVLLWATETSSSINFTGKEFKILSRETNLDNFITKFNLRETEN